MHVMDFSSKFLSKTESFQGTGGGYSGGGGYDRGSSGGGGRYGGGGGGGGYDAVEHNIILTSDRQWRYFE